MKILFVGSNPTPYNAATGAFVGTQSGRKLEKWLDYLEVKNYELVNCSDKVLPYGKTLRTADFNFDWVKQAVARTDCVIALGKNAAKALKMLKIEAFQLPHPSGLNRVTNDPAYLRLLLDTARDYIKHKEADHV